ncbi:FGGY-family carbohydrate kinase [Loktanella sp. SALINAS62]|uniref:FGGY-family carbohydrate kinase n=1 Tax=Loktanella sp. SALINAS62 TaxID=2706124 RepID=UPI001B8C4BFB|nr:FGGY-family carbohydrate kinase [Loktanella sp. SALINAS62]
MTACVIGVDVGTGSARAGVFDLTGHMLGTDSAPIEMHREGHDRVEQSSTDIWSAICSSVRGAVSSAGVDPADVAGIGFDATCSMVVQGQGGTPLPVGNPDAPERDVIVWMDHRAIEQARRINATGHSVLKYVGGRISPEMQTPKLLWLKENRPEVFDAAAGFFDLTDWFTWRATGSLARSVCTVTCKWTYLAHEKRWDADYFHTIGLEELADEGFARIGTQIVEPGTALANGLTDRAAQELGLPPNTPVAAGLIDAHAGGIGTVGAEGDPTENLAYVFGTSSCTMTTTDEPVFVPGVWGPYKSAMVPGAWLNEGGQSAAGAAIDALLAHHPASATVETGAESLPIVLAARAQSTSGNASGSVALARGIHVVPEFLGNRAPHADPDTRAVIAGLGMAQDEDSLTALYVAGICGIGYGLRQIVTAQRAEGINVERILISGGAGKSPYVRQILADTTGLEVVAPLAEEPVLLGSAILGAVAGAAHPSVTDAMSAMTRIGERYDPSQDHASIHDGRFQIFCRLQETMRKAASL